VSATRVPLLEAPSLDELVERVARRVVELLDDRDKASRYPSGLVDAATLAPLLGLTRDWVYEHATELGAREIGEGSRPRLRFDVAESIAQLPKIKAAGKGGRNLSKRSQAPDPSAGAARNAGGWRPAAQTAQGALPVRGG
jgi:hypothetical protein